MMPSAAHRAHASTAGVAYTPAAAIADGKGDRALGSILADPIIPLWLCLWAKVSDKSVFLIIFRTGGCHT